jgi:hypothetical protein
MHAEAIKLDPSSAAKRLMFNNALKLTAPRGRHCWPTEKTSVARVPLRGTGAAA